MPRPLAERVLEALPLELRDELNEGLAKAPRPPAHNSPLSLVGRHELESEVRAWRAWYPSWT